MHVRSVALAALVAVAYALADATAAQPGGGIGAALKADEGSKRTDRAVRALCCYDNAHVLSSVLDDDEAALKEAKRAFDSGNVSPQCADAKELLDNFVVWSHRYLDADAGKQGDAEDKTWPIQLGDGDVTNAALMAAGKLKALLQSFPAVARKILRESNPDNHGARLAHLNDLLSSLRSGLKKHAEQAEGERGPGNMRTAMRPQTRNVLAKCAGLYTAGEKVIRALKKKTGTGTSEKEDECEQEDPDAADDAGASLAADDGNDAPATLVDAMAARERTANTFTQETADGKLVANGARGGLGGQRKK